MDGVCCLSEYKYLYTIKKLKLMYAIKSKCLGAVVGKLYLIIDFTTVAVELKEINLDNVCTQGAQPALSVANPKASHPHRLQ